MAAIGGFTVGLQLAELGQIVDGRRSTGSLISASASLLTLAHPLQVAVLGSGVLPCEFPPLTLLVI